MTLLATVGGILAAVALVQAWRHERWLVWSSAGFAAGGGICWFTLAGTHTAWLPDLWDLERGSGYAAGVVVAVVAMVVGVVHR